MVPKVLYLLSFAAFQLAAAAGAAHASLVGGGGGGGLPACPRGRRPALQIQPFEFLGNFKIEVNFKISYYGIVSNM